MLTQYMRLFTLTGVFDAIANPLKDVSIKNNTDGFLVNFNHLYIAQHYPFLNFFIVMQTALAAGSGLVLEYWDGLEWRKCVDLIDGTNGLSQLGMVQFSTRNKWLWSKIPQTDDDSTGLPDELKGLYIDNCYWLRVSFDPALTQPLGTERIKRIGYAFTTTQYINVVDDDAPNYYASFTTQPNKADWVNEIMHASEEVVLDLKRIGFIKSAGQIVELDEVYLACAWKTLAHIYFQLGKAYDVNRAIVSNKYEKALENKALTFDTNRDGKLDANEVNSTYSRMTR